jgi:hypothetical protein
MSVVHVNVNTQFIKCVMSVNHLHLHIKKITFTLHEIYSDFCKVSMYIFLKYTYTTLF